jgi:hypothetical protein
VRFARSAVLALVALAATPAAATAAPLEILPEIAKMEAEGEKWFDVASNTELSPSERNEARKKAWVQIYPAYEALTRHCDEHPGDMGALEDRMMKVGQMKFWLAKESPVGLLESTGVGPKTKTSGRPKGWPEKPPPERPGNAPGAPEPGPAPPPGAPPPKDAPGGAPAPPAPPRRPLEEAFREADDYAKKHRADLAGILELFHGILTVYQDLTSHPLFLESAKRASEANRALKDFYRLRRNDDPDSLKNADGPEVKATVLALGRELLSKEPDARRRAAGLLGLIGSGDGVFPLVQAAQKETDPAALAAELDAVVAIGGRKGASQLGKLRDDRDLATKALDALAKICEKNAVERRIAGMEIARFALAKDEALADRAVDILVALGPEGAYGLVEALKSPSTALRLKLIPAVAATKSPRVAAPLSTFLISGDNPNTEVCRKAAMEAIKGLGEPAVPYLFAGLRSGETKQWTALLLREMTGQMFSMNRPGDWVTWWKKTHPEWKEEKD